MEKGYFHDSAIIEIALRILTPAYSLHVGCIFIYAYIQICIFTPVMFYLGLTIIYVMIKTTNNLKGKVRMGQVGLGAACLISQLLLSSFTKPVAAYFAAGITATEE